MAYKLPPEVIARYKDIPDDYATFLRICTTCHSPDDTVWILCEPDFMRRDPDKFRWNEWELLSLESATGFGSSEVRKVERFWMDHLPVLMSVRAGYAFVAVNVNTGRLVSAAEPDFESTSPVCDGFSDLLDLIAAAQGGDPAARAALALVL